MTVIPMLLAIGLADISLAMEPPRQFDLVCDGRAANIYDPDLSRPYRWAGHLDLDAGVVRADGDEGAPILLDLQDGRFARWGLLTYDRGRDQLIEASADGKELAVARCRQSPVF